VWQTEAQCVVTTEYRRLRVDRDRPLRYYYEKGKGFLLSPMVRSGQEGDSVPPESEYLVRIGLGSRTVRPKSNDNGYGQKLNSILLRLYTNLHI